MTDYTMTRPGIYRVYRGPIGTERKGRYADIEACSPAEAEDLMRERFAANYLLGLQARANAAAILSGQPRQDLSGDADWLASGIEIGAEQGQPATEEIRAPEFEATAEIEARHERARERALAARRRRADRIPT